MALGPDNKFLLRTERMTDAQAYRAGIDVGLREYMLRVYNYMALGVAFTGIVALLVAMNPAIMRAVAVGPFKWVLFIGIIGLGWFAPRVIVTKSVSTAHAAYWTYAAMWGVLMAPILWVYTGDSIVRVFFITAGAFAGTSLYGYTTKRNLSGLGSFFTMATIGILIALLVNMFLLQSTMFHMGLSVVVVLVFAGLTAYETQMIKNMYYEADGNDVATRKSIFGAFLLYGAFVTMFIWLLQIFGAMRE